jgi:hypothetical protein
MRGGQPAQYVEVVVKAGLGYGAVAMAGSLLAATRLLLVFLARASRADTGLIFR